VVTRGSRQPEGRETPIRETSRMSNDRVSPVPFGKLYLVFLF
jgi:hypothetical protein